MAKFSIATMLVIFISFNGFLSSSALILSAEGFKKHKTSDSSSEGRFRSMLLHSCEGGKTCMDRGLRFLSLRKKQPPSPPAPTRNSKKIHVIFHVSDRPLLPLWKRIEASVYESAPPSPP